MSAETLRGRIVLAFVISSASLAACSLIATFEDRPPHDAGAGGDAGPLPFVSAFPLEHCAAPGTDSPLAVQACDYRDQSCSGFADLGATYVEKAKAGGDGPALACDPGAVVAYEVIPAAGGETAPRELRLLGRERLAGGACPATGADAGEERLVVLRVDPETLTLLEAVPIEITPPPGAPPFAPGDLAFGRSERRLIAAYRAPDEKGAQKVWVMSTAIDQPPAALEQVPATWEMHLAARLPTSAAFVAGRTTGVDDVAPGRVYVAVDATEGLAPVLTFGDEEDTEEVPFTSKLAFTDESVAPGRADLHVRTRSKQGDAGLVVERVLPGAVARTRADPFVTVMVNTVRSSGLGDLRYLFVPDAGSPTGLAEPWYAAAAIFPENPGVGLGVEPAHVRLEIFGYEGATYAQLRGCAASADKACTLGASLAGGSKALDMSKVPACGASVPLAGATDPDPPDAKSSLPKVYATCALGPGAAGSGAVTWHRTAGGFGAAIGPGGTKLWVVRPGGAKVVGDEATIALASEVVPEVDLAAEGPLGVTFVDGLGWVVTAVDKAAGRLWARRFGCADLR